MKDPNRFYTYAYLREDGSPYYIGKGQGDRAYKKYRNIKPPKDKSRILLLKQNLTEEEAFKHEIYMISVFGRKDLGTGILRNKTNGGDGTSGFKHSEEFKIKQSKANENKKYWNDGKGNLVRSIECPGEGWFPGMGEESKRSKVIIRKRDKNSCYGKLWWHDGNGNHIRSVECPGENWILGLDDVYKEKIGNGNKDKRWWNDGNGNTKFTEECPGKGWVLGRGKIKKTL